MKMMASLMMMLSMMSLMGASSCGTVTRKVVCAQVRDAAIRPLPLYDISFQFNRCRVRCFDFNNWQTLKLKDCPTIPQDQPITYLVGRKSGVKSEVINLPLLSCEGVSGFLVDDMALEVRPKVKMLAAIREDYCE